MVLGQFSVQLHGKVTTLRTDYNAHIAVTAAGVHGSTVAATVNRLIHRDASGRAQVATPSAAADIATKGYVDGQVAGAGTVTSVGSGAGLTGGPITGSGSLALATSGVVANTYAYATVTVDQYGRITSASANTPVTSVGGTAPISSSGGATPTISISAATTGAAGSMSAADKTKLDNATQAATASRLMIRDAGGRAEVANPVSGNDIMNFTYWDANRVKRFDDLTGVTVSTSAPSGGVDGDLWLQYS